MNSVSTKWLTKSVVYSIGINRVIGGLQMFRLHLINDQWTRNAAKVAAEQYQQCKVRLSSRILLHSLILLIVSAVSSGCDGNGTSSTPVKSLLYAARSGVHNGSIDVFDCDTDSLVRTITDTSFRYSFWLSASPDGCFLLVNGDSGAMIWDITSEQAVALLSADIFTGVFSPNDDLLIGFGLEETFVYRVPTGDLVGRYDVELMNGVLVAGKPWIVGINVYNPWALTVFDYVQGVIVDTLTPFVGSGPMSVQYLTLAASPNAPFLYVGASVSGKPSVIGYDLERDSALFEFETTLLTSCEVTPDGEQIWVTESGFPQYPGSILVRNSRTGEFVTRIETEDYGTLAVQHIAFCPNANKAYVTSLSVAPILVVDQNGLTPIRTIFGDGLPEYTSVVIVPASD